MKKIQIVFAAFALVVFASCNDGKKTTEDADMMEQETMEEGMDMEDQRNDGAKEVAFLLESKNGSNASGKVTFSEDNGMVRFNAELTGLEEGTHAIHIHETADCSAADGSSAGGHWNPTFQPHGKWGDEAGYHKGDIGNFDVDASGKGSISMETNEWCIGCGDEKKDILNKAIIVHQGTDDYTSQPSGDAGKRMSCGAIIK